MSAGKRRFAAGRLGRRLSTERLETRNLMAVDVGNDLASLSDEFDDATSQADWSRVHQVEGWNADQLQVWDVDQTQAGRMTLVPHTVVWYQDRRGPMVFKDLSGDFVITSEVHISDRDDIGDSDADDIPDSAAFSLGGLMLRTPRPIEDPSVDWVPGTMADDGTNTGENYVFLSLGHGNDGANMSLEVKTTRNSNSQLELNTVNSSMATLQVARIGDAIITLYQLPGQDWVVHRRYSRPDFPDQLQAGLVSYTDWNKASDFDPFFHNSHTLSAGSVADPTPAEPFNPDLVAGFEYARFVRPDIPAALEGVDLVQQASDQQLLSFLGDHANPEPDVPDPNEETLVRFELETTDLNGQSVESVEVGEAFQLQIYVEDARTANLGVFAAYLDVNFNNQLAQTDGPVVFGNDFPNARSVDLQQAGVVNEAGGVGGLAASGGRTLLLTVPLRATAPGNLLLDSNAADETPAHHVLLLGSSTPVSADAVEFGQTTLSIMADGPIAQDDDFTRFHDGQSSLLNVLDNDQASYGASLAIHEVGATSAGGSAVLLPNGELHYTPAEGFYGQETFAYTAIDSYGGMSEANVTVRVHKRWHNADNPLDVDRDDHTAPLDALYLVNVLNSLGAQALPAVPSGPWIALPMIDVNNDGHVAPGDVLAIFNFLNGQMGGSGEGEAADHDAGTVARVIDNHAAIREPMAPVVAAPTASPSAVPTASVDLAGDGANRSLPATRRARTQPGSEASLLQPRHVRDELFSWFDVNDQEDVLNLLAQSR